MANIGDMAQTVEELWLGNALHDAMLNLNASKGKYDDVFAEFNRKIYDNEKEKERALLEIINLLDIPKECECGEPIQEGRRRMLKVICVTCQELKEKKYR